jgi:hypothetical protein
VENAHIVAFRNQGPRGDSDRPVVDNNGIENLMLLCAVCHKLVNDNPGKYTRAVLEAHKKEHEARIKRVTDVGPDAQTTVLQLKTRIGASAVEISQTEIFDALQPRYPAGDAVVIDLTGLGDEKGGPRYRAVAEAIAGETNRLYANGSGLRQTNHLSVFGLRPCAHSLADGALGNALSNKVKTDFFQCHRNKSNRWTWFEGEEPVEYAVRKRQSGSGAKCVALMLSLSGTIDTASLPGLIGGHFSIYEVTLTGQVPNIGSCASVRTWKLSATCTDGCLPIFDTIIPVCASSMSFRLCPRRSQLYAVSTSCRRSIRPLWPTTTS